MRPAQRAPALRAASRTARFSTSVTPDGMPSSIRGRAIVPDPVVDLVDEVLDHLLGHVEVADDAVAQRPDRDDVGRRPADHPLGLGADGQDPLGLGVDGHDGRLAHDDPAVADVDQRVGGPEVDPDVAGEEAEDPVEHVRGGSFVTAGDCRVALRWSLRGSVRGGGGREPRRCRAGRAEHGPCRAGSAGSIPGRPARGRVVSRSRAPGRRADRTPRPGRAARRTRRGR